MEEFYNLFPFPRNQVDNAINNLDSKRKVLVCSHFGILGVPKISDRAIARLLGYKEQTIPQRVDYSLKLIFAGICRANNMEVPVQITKIK